MSHDEEGLSSEKKKKKRRSSNDEEEEKEQEERQKTTTSRSSSAADSRERPLSLSDDYKRRRTLPVVGTRLATHDEVQSRNEEEPSSKNQFSSLRLRQKNHDLGKIISSVGKTIRKQGNTLIL